MSRFALKKNSVWNFSAMQFMLWGSWASFGQFFAYFLKESGYSPRQVSIASICFTVFSLFGQYMWGRLCDYKKKMKSVYQLMIITVTVFVILFWAFVDSPIAVYLITGMIGFSWMPKEAVLDTWSMNSPNIKKSYYGLMRMGGSLGWALMCTFVGKVIDVHGWDMMFYIYLGMTTIDFLVVSIAHDSYGGHDVETDDKHVKGHIKDLLKNKFYILLLIFVFLIGVSKFMILNFMPFVFDDLGGTQVHVGYAAAIAAYFEIPTFIISTKVIGRFKPTRVFLVGAVFYLIRSILIASAVEPWLAISGFAFQAMGFGLILAVSRELITKIAPKDLVATAQTLFSAFYFSVSGVLASYLGGYLLEEFTIELYHRVGLVFISLAVLLMLFVNIRYKHDLSVQKG